MLCSWRKGEVISAGHLNLMTDAINANTEEIDSITKQFNEQGSSSINASGGIHMGGFVSSGLDSCESCLNRGFIRTGWEYTASGDSVKTGVYLNKSGVETATGATYPGSICTVKLCEKIAGISLEDIVIKVKTDEYGKVLSQCIKLQGSDTCTKNTYWTGPVQSCASQPCYEFTRRVGRIISDEVRPVSPCDSTRLNKVMSTNDIIMPILPARTEREEKTDCKHTISLIGNFKENSILIKNIANGGGLKLDTSCQPRVTVASGVEFHRACVKESTESCGSSTTTTWPQIPKHIEPKPFDITIACIPVKEQHYRWDLMTSSWIPYSSADSGVVNPCAELKGTIKIQAKSLCGANWQIGWASSGQIEIPVKDFTPTEVSTYKEGRGINIVECKENTGTEEEPYEVTYYKICNTMKLCAGCGIKICEVSQCEPAYKIHAPASKLSACRGIVVHQKATNDWLVSDQLTISGGTGIIAKRNANDFNVTLDLNAIQHTTVSAGDGIQVTQTGNNYRVSLKPPCASCSCSETYVFDPNWFTVTR